METAKRNINIESKVDVQGHKVHVIFLRNNGLTKMNYRHSLNCLDCMHFVRKELCYDHSMSICLTYFFKSLSLTMSDIDPKNRKLCVSVTYLDIK